VAQFAELGTWCFIWTQHGHSNHSVQPKNS